MERACVEERFREGLALHKSGNVEQAAAVYREVLRDRPDHAGAWHLLGVVHRARGDLKAALEHIEQALSYCDTKAVYWNNYGAVLKDLRRYEDAKAAFEKALQIREHYADAWSNLGLIHLELGYLDDADRCLRWALRLEPRHADALRHLAAVSHDKGEFEEAVKFCRDAAAAGLGESDVYDLEGGILAGMKRHEEAVNAYEKAISCDPEAADRHLKLGWALTASCGRRAARPSSR